LLWARLEVKQSQKDGPTRSSVDTFVWTKIEAEAGEGIGGILVRKEAEALAGKRVFWWGTGKSISKTLQEASTDCGGLLPLVFSKMLGKAKLIDSSPATTWVWTHWKDQSGQILKVPDHVLVTSRGSEAKNKHYALACRCVESVRLHDQRLNPTSWENYGRPTNIGNSQVTAVVRGSLKMGHARDKYTHGFRAQIVDCVTLVKYRTLTKKDIDRLKAWNGGDWMAFVRSFRG
jgi:hypothetical protein